MTKSYLTVEGYVRQVEKDTKKIRFAIPVYAGKQGEDVKTKWFNFVSFKPDILEWLESGDYVRVQNAYVSIYDGRTTTFESWVVPDKTGKVEKMDAPERKHEADQSTTSKRERKNDNVPF